MIQRLSYEVTKVALKKYFNKIKGFRIYEGYGALTHFQKLNSNVTYKVSEVIKVTQGLKMEEGLPSFNKACLKNFSRS